MGGCGRGARYRGCRSRSGSKRGRSGRRQGRRGRRGRGGRNGRTCRGSGRCHGGRGGRTRRRSGRHGNRSSRSSRSRRDAGLDCRGRDYRRIVVPHGWRTCRPRSRRSRCLHGRRYGRRGRRGRRLRRLRRGFVLRWRRRFVRRLRALESLEKTEHGIGPDDGAAGARRARLLLPTTETRILSGARPQAVARACGNVRLISGGRGSGRPV